MAGGRAVVRSKTTETRIPSGIRAALHATLQGARALYEITVIRDSVLDYGAQRRPLRVET
jgi:hypothetical protein